MNEGSESIHMLVSLRSKWLKPAIKIDGTA